jgi:hypothetical protein
MKHDLARMIPAYFPRPLLLVYIMGFLELLGAAGLVIPEFRKASPRSSPLDQAGRTRGARLGEVQAELSGDTDALLTE